MVEVHHVRRVLRVTIGTWNVLGNIDDGSHLLTMPKVFVQICPLVAFVVAGLVAPSASLTVAFVAILAARLLEKVLLQVFWQMAAAACLRHVLTTFKDEMVPQEGLEPTIFLIRSQVL